MELSVYGVAPLVSRLRAGRAADRPRRPPLRPRLPPPPRHPPRRRPPPRSPRRPPVGAAGATGARFPPAAPRRTVALPSPRSALPCGRTPQPRCALVGDGAAPRAGVGGISRTRRWNPPAGRSACRCRRPSPSASMDAGDVAAAAASPTPAPPSSTPPSSRARCGTGSLRRPNAVRPSWRPAPCDARASAPALAARPRSRPHRHARPRERRGAAPRAAATRRPPRRGRRFACRVAADLRHWLGHCLPRVLRPLGIGPTLSPVALCS